MARQTVSARPPPDPQTARCHPRPRAASISAPRWFRSACIALLGIAVLGCGGSARDAAPAAIRLVDDAGDTVALPAAARRIVSLIPATTELLFAIGAGPQVVGRTQYDDWPSDALAVPVVSEGISLNLEGIVAARPDLVIVYPSTVNTAGVERLRALGIPAFQARTDRITDIVRLARVLGRATGRASAADSVAHALARELVAATAPAASDTAALFILVWDQPPITIGAESYLTEIMQRAGARNIFADLAAPSAPVSIEAVAARNPDFVLTTSDSGVPAFASRPEWQAVAAVRERRFISITGSQFEHPGPRTPSAIRELRRRLDVAR